MATMHFHKAQKCISCKNIFSAFFLMPRLIWQKQKTTDPVHRVYDCDNDAAIVLLIGTCIATWYAAFRYLEKLTELETSCGRGDTVTY